MATRLVTKRCDLGSLGVPGLASTVGGQTSWLARMFGLCQDDIILAEANILAYPKIWDMGQTQNAAWTDECEVDYHSRARHVVGKPSGQVSVLLGG